MNMVFKGGCAVFQAHPPVFNLLLFLFVHPVAMVR